MGERNKKPKSRRDKQVENALYKKANGYEYEERKNTKEISEQLGMTAEEIFRLSDFSRDEFLDMMARSATYSKAEYIVKY